jgi:DNA-binding HxlR family transcriptional regulator
MRHEDLLAANCAIGRTGAVLGERWVFAILRAAFLRARTFEDYQRQTGIARNILSDRLGRLVDFGILERRAYSQGAKRTLNEYRLTQAGLDLYPIVVAIMEWGNRHTGLLNGPPVELVHRTCGAVTHPQLVCSACGEPIDAHDVEPRRGPGHAEPAPAWTPLAAGA